MNNFIKRQLIGIAQGAVILMWLPGILLTSSCNGGNRVIEPIRGDISIEVEREDEGPNEYYCPITQELMKDPVIAKDGHTYEREEIEKWFNKKEKEGNPITSPKTGDILDSTGLVPNYALRSLIQDFKEQKKRQEEYIPQEEKRRKAEEGQLLIQDFEDPKEKRRIFKDHLVDTVNQFAPNCGGEHPDWIYMNKLRNHFETLKNDYKHDQAKLDMCESVIAKIGNGNDGYHRPEQYHPNLGEYAHPDWEYKRGFCQYLRDTL